VLLAVSLLAGILPTEGAQAPAKAPPAPPVAPDRVVLLAATDEAYRALAIPRAYKTSAFAPTRLLVFRGGLCIRDHGLAESRKGDEGGAQKSGIIQETGRIERAYVSEDGREAIVAKTRYVSQVDMTPGQKSTANDTVKGDTTLTLVDPAHPDGRWRVTLENARWVKDVLVLPAGKGVVVTTFLPRKGPADLRILDSTGRESLRVPEYSAETVRIKSSPEGGHVAAEVTFQAKGKLPERGVIVFDLERGTQWTYGWRYGSDAEPLSWSLLEGGVLGVKLADGTQRFDPTGRKL